MLTPSSNMISKNYCPDCGGFDLVKLHRSFIQKRILDAPNKLSCQECGRVLSITDFSNNIAKEMPLFLDGSGTNALVEPVVEITESPVSVAEIALEQSLPDLIRENETDEVLHQYAPKKRKGALTWLLYTMGLLVISGTAYLGYRYINDSTEITPKESDVSVNAPQALDTIIKTDIEEPSITPQIQVSIIEVPEEPQQIAALEPSIVIIEVPQINKAPIAAVEVVEVLQLATEIVEKRPELMQVPKPEIEIRIVLPLKDPVSPLKSTNVADTSKTIKKAPEVTDPLIEKAAIEFMKNDLDELLGN